MVSAREKLSRLGGLSPERVPKTPRVEARSPLYTYTTTYPRDARHGTQALAPALAVTSRALATLAKDERFADIRADELLYIDTETTGLWGGVGTVPFLVGLGFVENQKFVTEQLLLGQLGHEKPLLTRLYERLVKARALVSYNGKCFDWPLIKARFLLNRWSLSPEIEHKAHLDLLFACRRLVVGLKDHRLQSLEASLCAYQRIGDIPGAQIPEMYFAYLRHGQVEQLQGVIEHNRLDIVAMMAFLGALARRLEPAHAKELATLELLAVARLKEVANRQEEALGLAYTALCQGRGADALAAALWAARLHGRAGAWQKAARLLERGLLASQGAPAGAAHLALAKIFEHRLIDLPRALRHAVRTHPAETAEEQVRRRQRLRRRLGRQSEGSALR